VFPLVHNSFALAVCLEVSSLTQVTKQESLHNQLLEVRAVSLIVDGENFISSKIARRVALSPVKYIIDSSRVDLFSRLPHSVRDVSR